jgi:hypothetical protein
MAGPITHLHCGYLLDLICQSITNAGPIAGLGPISGMVLIEGGQSDSDDQPAPSPAGAYRFAPDPNGKMKKCGRRQAKAIHKF